MRTDWLAGPATDAVFLSSSESELLEDRLFLAGEADRLDFLGDRLDFLGDRLDFLEDWLDFLGDRLNFLGDRLDFLEDWLDFLGDRLDFLGDRLAFLGERSEVSTCCSVLLSPFGSF